MTPGPMEFRGPIKRPNGLLEPIKMTLTNQFVKDRRLFLGEEHIKIRTKLRHFALRPFFFRRSHESSEKVGPFIYSVLDHTNPKLHVI